MLGPFKIEGHCTFCGSGRDVLCYPSKRAEIQHLPGSEKWPDAEHNPTACPDCCAENIGHDYTYCRSDREWSCDHCGEEPPQDFYNDLGDDW